MNWCVTKVYWHTIILDTRMSSVLSPYCSGYPPGVCNGRDWRALVESCPPNVGKLRKKVFFSLFFLQKKKILKFFGNDFLIFPYFLTILDNFFNGSYNFLFGFFFWGGGLFCGFFENFLNFSRFSNFLTIFDNLIKKNI